MNVALAIEMDDSFEFLAPTLALLDRQLRDGFREASYGAGVETVFIGLILIDSRSTRFHSLRKSRYRQSYDYTDRIRGCKVHLENVLEFDARPDLELIHKFGRPSAGEIIAKSILASARALDKSLFSSAEFDLEAFCSDMEHHLSANFD